MSALRPKLRRSITGHPDPEDNDFVWLYDSFKLSPQSVRLHRDAIPILEHFNGRASLPDIQSGWAKAGLGLLPSSVLEKIVGTLDQALLLESDRFQEFVSRFLTDPIRPPTCAGSCYAADLKELRHQIEFLFTAPGGPGLPDLCATPDGSLRGALIPHIDFGRGNITYGWGFKEVVEKSNADVYVILGTSHFSPHRYTLTRKDFETPLGVVKTDQAYVNRIAERYGKGGFADELAHFPEHSIELHVVVLQYLLQQRGRDFAIVPVLVGSFQDSIDQGKEPETRNDIRRMITALRDAEAACGRNVCYLISGDLAHIGPKFGDSEPLNDRQRQHSGAQDQAILRALTGCDRAGLYSVLHEERDARRICGFPPAYTFLAAIGASSARMMHYQQYAEPRGIESVSFASVAFYR
jgi:MEMO1 family protein